MNEKTVPSAADALLVEGARSYLEAFSALLFYQREVQKKCRDVMTGYLGKYAEALGVALGHDEIVETAWPKAPEWDGTYAQLGVKIAKDREIPGIRWWETYCSVQWDSEDPKFSCWIGEWFPTVKMATDICKSLRRLDVKVTAEEKLVYIDMALRPEQGATFDKALIDLSQRWINLWKKAGGMKKVFRDI